MKKKRHSYTPEEKVIILKRHLIDKVPVSDICDKYNLQPTVFYRWQKEFFENGAAAFDRPKSRQEKMRNKRVLALEKKLQTKNGFLSRISGFEVMVFQNLISRVAKRRDPNNLVA